MSFFRVLLRTRADTRSSSLHSRAPSRSPRSSLYGLRLNSSVSSQPVQNTPTASGSESKSTNTSHNRIQQLSDDLWRNQADINSLHSQIGRLRRRLRSTHRVINGGPWMILKNWYLQTKQEEVTFENNLVRVGEQKIPNMWLRDNCQCSSCMHGETKQRLVDTFSIPKDISIKTCATFRTYIDVTWSDGHHSRYDKGLLNAAAFNTKVRAEVRQGYPDRIFTWGSEIALNKPICNWRKPGVPLNTADKSKTDDDLILNALFKIRRYGFCYIDGVDATPEATEALLKRIAFIRETHYGGFYDFTADLAKADTAYTNIALPAHTDNTYFSDPAGLQAFHLLSHTDGEGGASLLVDGFKAAETLLAEDKDAYHVLATVNVHAHASGNDGISIQPYRGFPVLEHDTETGTLLRVRWNTSDRAGIELPLEEVDKWYAAARKFDAILKKRGNEYWEQLQPGTVLIFDNWRVLHGRTKFTGKRRICGAYINRDDWISRFKMLYYGKEEVLGKLASG